MKFKKKIAIGYIRTKFKMMTALSKRMAAEKAFELFCTPFDRSNGKLPAIFEQAERLHFSIYGKKVYGFGWNRHQPHKVLILHGFGSAAYKFHQYISPLIDKGYGVLAFDAPAHGISEGTSINAIEYCHMIEQVCGLYGPVKGFLAHSFGCIALSLALEKMTHGPDTRIVFIAPATETSSAVEAAFKMLQIKDEQVKKEFDNIIYEKGGQKTEWYSIRRAMRNINASVLWFHDEEDDVTPCNDALKVKDENFPNIRFVITRGLGHRKIYSDSSIRKQVLAFL